MSTFVILLEGVSHIDFRILRISEIWIICSSRAICKLLLRALRLDTRRIRFLRRNLLLLKRKMERWKRLWRRRRKLWRRSSSRIFWKIGRGFLLSNKFSTEFGFQWDWVLWVVLVWKSCAGTLMFPIVSRLIQKGGFGGSMWSGRIMKKRDSQLGRELIGRKRRLKAIKLWIRTIYSCLRWVDPSTSQRGRCLLISD